MMDNKMLTPDERARELARIRDGMIRQDYYLMHRRPLAPEKKAGVLLEHFQWIVAMEKDGHILFTGARFDRAGAQNEGLTVLRAPNWEEAERLSATDPFVTSGAVSFYIERWVLGGGRITMSIEFSDRSMRFA
jgi:uncharacterized protein YciI